MPIRKRQRCITPSGSDTEGSTQHPYSHQDVIDLNMIADTLWRLVQESTNVKREIRETASQLMAKVAAVTFLVEDLAPPITVDKEMQTDKPVRAIVTNTEMKQKLEQGVERDSIPELISQKWPEEFFQHVETKMGTPELDKGSEVIMVLDLNGNKKGPFARKVCDFAPRVCRMLNEGSVVPGSVLHDAPMAEVVLGASAAEQVSVGTYVLFIDTKLEESAVNSHLVEGITRIESVAQSTLPVGVVLGRTSHKLRRILEYNSRRDGVNRVLYQLMEEKTPRSRSKSTEPIKTVVIKKEGLSYAQLLREVKAGTGETASGVVIAARKGRGEALELRLRDGAGNAKAVVDKVQQNVEGAQITTGGRSARPVVVHIRGMDEETKEADILKAVREALPDEERHDIRVSSVRPAFGQTQNATVILPKKAADTLVAKDRINIGWLSCKVVLREDVPRCFRCWEPGHLAGSCRGPDRRNSCYNCGMAGHFSRNCREASKCVKCGQDGHRFGSPTCRQGKERPRE